MQGSPVPHMPTSPAPMQTTQAELRAKFDALDADKSGYIEAMEIYNLFNTNPADPMPFTTARMMIRMFSSTGRVDFNNFILLDQFLSSCSSSFAACDVERKYRIPVTSAISTFRAQGFEFTDDEFKSILRIFIKGPEKNFVSYSDYISTSVFLNLTRINFQKWDTSKTGRITLDYQALVNCLLWFM